MNDSISRTAAIDSLYCGICTQRLLDLPSARPYTEADIQKMQDLEQAELEKAFELGREDALSEIVRCKDCKYAEVADSEDHQDGYTCRFHRGSIWFSGSYCSFAVRKENV